jgi:ribosome biogenesis protein YTM1
MNTEKNPDRQVFVRFLTKLPEYEITNTPISIPVKFRRLGLSQVINHLLGSTGSPIPFDFLLNNVFLRSSLEKFIEQHNIKEESTINIEYILALGEPDTSDALQHDDWISALDNHQTLHDNIIFSGSYDTLIRVWKPKSNIPIFALEGHMGHITSLSSKKTNNDNEIILVSGSQDQTIKVWNVNTVTKSFNCTRNLIGHTDTVTACDINPIYNTVMSASWDMNIKLWDLAVQESDADSMAVPTSYDSEVSSKKRKINPKIINQKPQYTFTGHRQAVTCLRWTAKDEIISGSLDFNICFWDCNSGTNTDTKHGNKPVTCVSYAPDSQMALSSHTDGIIRLWDKRTDKLETSSSFTSHGVWVSTVQFHPTRTNYFISGAYDNRIKIWDTRSTTALYTIKIHQGKILCSTWFNNSTFLTGGEDKKIQTHTLQN